MKIMLFTTPTCQYCGPAKELVKNIENIEILNAMENLDLAELYGIRSVPALVLEKCSGNEVLVGLEQITNFVENEENFSGNCGCNCGH
ncbi:Glutaredoxin [Cetobacterium ceti]|uniref:Glutaredoxin n=1 Tax=Cetobacterium ceti TaxID=180163 RepID=A0A1T4QXL3_9FUSO|nr:glutaredoxin domain-containing protein [Cetobacterium ceti]SKA08201.1 Glutaredoxin [Cetobacterium ceti]